MDIKCPPRTLGNFSKGSSQFMDIRCPPNTLGNFSKCCSQYFFKILTLGKETMNSTNMKVFVSVSVLLEPALGLEPALEQILMLLEPARIRTTNTTKFWSTKLKRLVGKKECRVRCIYAKGISQVSAL
jgi:hypothetical protein